MYFTPKAIPHYIPISPSADGDYVCLVEENAILHNAKFRNGHLSIGVVPSSYATYSKETCLFKDVSKCQKSNNILRRIIMNHISLRLL